MKRRKTKILKSMNYEQTQIMRQNMYKKVSKKNKMRKSSQNKNSQTNSSNGYQKLFKIYQKIDLVEEMINKELGKNIGIRERKKNSEEIIDFTKTKNFLIILKYKKKKFYVLILNFSLNLTELKNA